MKKRTFIQSIALTASSPLSLWAQNNSSRPIRMLVPLPAGTSNDFVTRVICPHVSKRLGQPILIENKPGANGVIATMDVVKAAPDGLTLVCASLSPLATNVAFVKNLPYEPLRDLTPIAGASLTNHVLVVRAESPIRTFADFIAFAKNNPGKVSVGSSTTVVQLQIATINKLAGVDLLTIPYKGTPASITDVIGGVLEATLTDQGNAMAQVKGGKLRAIAVSSLKRNPATPDWPAISESLPDFDFSSWNAFMGPAGMPKELVHRISDAIIQVQKQTDVIQQLATTGTVPLVLNPEEVKTYIAADINKWVRLARESNIQPE